VSRRPSWIAVAAVSAVVAAAAPRASAAPEPEPVPEAAANPVPDPGPTGERVHTGRAIIETLAVLIAGTGWYWTNTNLNAEDWELQWDWESWRKKVMLEAYCFDTNTFSVNGVRHTWAGVVYYQVGRANGFSVGGALLLDFVVTTFWELVVEFKESASLNDLVINSIGGVGLGEPMVQLGRQAQHSRSPLGKVIAFLLSPFEAFHEIVAPPHRPWREPWHDFRFYTGGSRARFDDSTREELTLGLDLELVTIDGYAKPGRRTVRSRAAEWTRLVASITTGPDDSHPDAPIQAGRIDGRTSLLGRLVQDFDARGRGTGSYVGLATGFAVEWRRLAEEPDRLAVAHLVGGQVEATARNDSLALRWELLAFADFAMVQAHVFGPRLPFTPQPEPPYTSALRTYGYYFALGATASTRLRVDADRWGVDLELAAQHFESIDGLDRKEIGGPDDPHDVVDQRLTTRVAVELDPFDAGVSLRPYVETVLRRGLWEDRERATLEVDLGLQLSFDF
jgi:hypothetical protein